MLEINCGTSRDCSACMVRGLEGEHTERRTRTALIQATEPTETGFRQTRDEATELAVRIIDTPIVESLALSDSERAAAVTAIEVAIPRIYSRQCVRDTANNGGFCNGKDI